MKNIFLVFTLIVAIYTVSIKPADASVSCPGKVTNLLNWETKCSGNLAFRHSGVSKGKTWVCATSELSSAFVMLAYANQSTMTVRLPSSCTATHYRTPLYLGLR